MIVAPSVTFDVASGDTHEATPVTNIPATHGGGLHGSSVLRRQHAGAPDGRLKLSVFGQAGHNYTLLASTNLATWVPILSFACTNDLSSRFYRLAPPSSVPGLKLGLGAVHPLNSNGLDLVLFCLPGLKYRLESSSNLVDWTAVTNVLSTNTTMHLLDASAANYSRRFYRAVGP